MTDKKEAGNSNIATLAATVNQYLDHDGLVELVTLLKKYVDDKAADVADSRITGIETYVEPPLNLEGTISGNLAKIYGSVDMATVATCGTVKPWAVIKFGTNASSGTPENIQYDSEMDSDNMDSWYGVSILNQGDDNYYTGRLAICTGWPKPCSATTASSLSNVSYIIGINSRGIVYKIPISMITGE